MLFFVDAIACATPEDLFLPSPTPAQLFDGSLVQTPCPASLRKVSTFWVVPDSSERKNTVMLSLGREAPEFSFAICGSFHFLILPVKISAATFGVSTSLSTPSRL